MYSFLGPIASSLVGDVVKYGVDALNDIRQGNEVRDFDLAGTISNALFGAAWSKLPGKYIGKFKDLIEEAAGKY